MIFWIALPISLLIITALSVMGQHIFHDFVDLHVVGRHAVLVVLVWLSLGWYFEARNGIYLADRVEYCLDTVSARFELLRGRVLRYLD